MLLIASLLRAMFFIADYAGSWVGESSPMKGAQIQPPRLLRLNEHSIWNRPN